MNLAIIQARMASTRLPGKSLERLAGVPLLSHVIRRTWAVEGIDAVCVALPETMDNDPLAEVAQAEDAAVCRGATDDVLSRFQKAAEAMGAVGADLLIRVTADDPWKDPAETAHCLALAKEQAGAFIVSNCHPHQVPLGLDVEVFPAALLCAAYNQATFPAHREHVTPWMYANADTVLAHPLRRCSKYRWTIDTPADLAFARCVYEKLYPTQRLFNAEAVVGLTFRDTEVRRLHDRAVWGAQ